jgi:FdhD protein
MPIEQALRFPTTVYRGSLAPGQRLLPEEVAVALTYDRVTYAVMMATPADLADFAVGFSLSEGIVTDRGEIAALEIAELPLGVECRMSLVPARREAMARRRRHLAGPMGCGLCGIDSLQEAVRPVPQVGAGLVVSAEEIAAALARLPELQRLNQQTKGIHAAALYHAPSQTMMVREDVGRHNALDKVIGAVAGNGWDPGACIAYLTSRVSIELIQKAAVFGATIIVAVSVPSARAVREACDSRITLIAVARDDGFEIFSHPERITGAYGPSQSAG